MQKEFILCPNCNSKTRIKVFSETELKNFPLFCPKCKKETLINFSNTIITPVQKLKANYD